MSDTTDSKATQAKAEAPEAKQATEKKAKSEASAEPKESAPKYRVERFRTSDGPIMTGQPAYVLAGALAGKSDDDELTIHQVQTAADKFLNSKVQEG